MSCRLRCCCVVDLKLFKIKILNRKIIYIGLDRISEDNPKALPKFFECSMAAASENGVAIWQHHRLLFL